MLILYTTGRRQVDPPNRSLGLLLVASPLSRVRFTGMGPLLTLTLLYHRQLRCR